MPRQARLDAPGLAHHVMSRGLNRQRIFLGVRDYEDFLSRIEEARRRSPVDILAWALMPNHVHLLVRSGSQGISPFFRRLLTGYAQAFNRRHHRVGYLFQGRFKSLVCEEEDYLLMLVRYIHLNPIAGKIVASLQNLRTYPYTGHGGLMGRSPKAWQSIDEILGRFGKQAGTSRRRYETFLADGVSEASGLATDLLGGGLLERIQKSAGRARREEDRAFFDPRVLGENDFVERVWKETEERETAQRQARRTGMDVRTLAKRIAAQFGLKERQLFERGRQADVSEGKAVLIYAGVEYLGKTTQEMARLTHMSGPAAGKARWRGAANARVDFKKLLS